MVVHHIPIITCGKTRAVSVSLHTITVCIDTACAYPTLTSNHGLYAVDRSATESRLAVPQAVPRLVNCRHYWNISHPNQLEAFSGQQVCATAKHRSGMGTCLCLTHNLGNLAEMIVGVGQPQYKPTTRINRRRARPRFDNVVEMWMVGPHIQ